MAKECYTVVPRPEGGWQVLNELDIIVRHSPRRYLMEKYANDPGWRLELAYGSMQSEKMMMRLSQCPSPSDG